MLFRSVPGTNGVRATRTKFLELTSISGEKQDEAVIITDLNSSRDPQAISNNNFRVVHKITSKANFRTSSSNFKTNQDEFKVTEHFSSSKGQPSSRGVLKISSDLGSPVE